MAQFTSTSNLIAGGTSGIGPVVAQRVVAEGASFLHWNDTSYVTGSQYAEDGGIVMA